MPVNRYLGAPFGQYQSQYIPLPFQELAAIGEKKQQQYEEGKQLPSYLQGLYQSLNAAPGHEQWKMDKINEYGQKMQDLVSGAKGDFGSSDFKVKAGQLINDFRNDQEIQTIQNSYNWFVKHYTDYKSDPKNQKDIDRTLPYDYTTGEIRQNKNPYYQLRIIKYSNPFEDQDKIMKNLVPQENEYKGFDRNPDGSLKVVDGYLHKGGSKVRKLTENEIYDFARRNVDAYANTEGGRYSIAQKLHNMGLDPITLDYEHLDDVNPIGKTKDGKSITLKGYINALLTQELTDIKQPIKEISTEEQVQEDWKSIKDYETLGTGLSIPFTIAPVQGENPFTKDIYGNIIPDISKINIPQSLKNTNVVDLLNFKLKDKPDPKNYYQNIGVGESGESIFNTSKYNKDISDWNSAQQELFKFKEAKSKYLQQIINTSKNPELVKQSQQQLDELQHPKSYGQLYDNLLKEYAIAESKWMMNAPQIAQFTNQESANSKLEILNQKGTQVFKVDNTSQPQSLTDMLNSIGYGELGESDAVTLFTKIMSNPATSSVSGDAVGRDVNGHTAVNILGGDGQWHMIFVSPSETKQQYFSNSTMVNQKGENSWQGYYYDPEVQKQIPGTFQSLTVPINGEYKTIVKFISPVLGSIELTPQDIYNSDNLMWRKSSYYHTNLPKLEKKETY